MRRWTLFALCLIAAIAACAPAEKQPNDDQPGLRTITLLRQPASTSEGELLAMVDSLNAAIHETGYPNSGYRLWRANGSTHDGHMYMWEGTWPSQAAYDSIHQHPAYRRINQQLEGRFDTAWVSSYTTYVPAR
jgi:quinol monooxygenase YgiN